MGVTVKSYSYLTNHQIAHDRCTLVCEFREAAVDEQLRPYWDQTHVLNSNYDAKPSVLGIAPTQGRKLK